MKKFITLAAAVAITITASAESLTASFGSANATTKDTPVPCAGFTVPEAYNPGGNSKVNVYNGDKGMKLRANKGAGENELMLTVNEGCTITGMTMGMVVNDANSTFTLSGISIDGAAVADFSSISLPNTTDAAGQAVVDLTGIKATRDIVFTYDFEGYSGKNRQVFIAGTVTYEEGAAASVFEWTPMSLYPNPSVDVTDTYFLENLNFNCYEEGVAITDVMPVWVDEDGNEIKAVSGLQNPWGFDPSAFTYQFDSSAFTANGEYILLFPEGMLVNAAGDKSCKIQTPYTLDIPKLAPAMFNDFEVLSLTPELSQPQAIWTDQVVTINTNHNDAIGLTTLSITDTTTGEVVCVSSSFSTMRELGNEAPVTWEVVGTYKFYEGHVYKAEFTFYNGQDEVDPEGVPTKIVDRVSYEFTGRVEGFKYSDITLVSVDPEPLSVVISKPSQAVFTYTFSGPVSVYKAASPLGQEGQNVYLPSCLSSNEDKTVWTLDLSEDDYIKTIDAMLTIYIYARDLDGFQLKGDWGEENESCFVSEWQCDLGAFPIEVVSPAAGESIDRLSEIVVKAADGKPMSWSWMGEAYVMNQLGDILGTLVYDAPADEEADSALEEIRFTRWMDENWTVSDIDLVKEGYYAIVFGPGCFLQGEQFDSKQSQSLTSTVIITGALDNPTPGIDPAEQEVFYFDKVSPSVDEKITSLSKIQLWYPEIVACEEFTVNVYNTADQSLVTTGKGLYSWDDYYLIDIDLSEPVTENGVYEVVIPARAIYTENFEDGVAGICNPEIKLLYTVGEGSGVGSVAAEVAGAVYDVNGRIVLRNASAADINSLQKGVYIIGGKKVVK